VLRVSALFPPRPLRLHSFPGLDRSIDKVRGRLDSIPHRTPSLLGLWLFSFGEACLWVGCLGGGGVAVGYSDAGGCSCGLFFGFLLSCVILGGGARWERGGGEA